MEDLELTYRAKTYIEKLANGINPLTDEPVADEDVVNNVRISRCFFYVADVLDCVIRNGGIEKKPKKRRKSFSITDEQLNDFAYSDYPISLSQIIERVGALVDLTQMKKPSYKVIANNLKEMGILENANGRYGRTRSCPTEMGKELGLILSCRISRTGEEVYATYYNRNAQEFVLNHIHEITKK